MQDGRLLVTSIDHGRIYAVGDGRARPYAQPGGGPNGATEGDAGLLFVAQNGGRLMGQTVDAKATGGIQVVDPDGDIRWVSRDPIAPNDLCFGPDGALYVTDPTRSRRDDGRIWRCDPRSGATELLATVGWYPNGIAFGPEDDALYVASTWEQRIVRFPLDGGRLGAPEVVVQMRRGHPDGFAFDADGNLVVTALALDDEIAAGQLQVWVPGGRMLETVDLGTGRLYTNVAFGADRRLVVTASDGGVVLVFDEWPQAGLLLHPFR